MKNSSQCSPENMSCPHVVIVGGGFGGLYAAKTLANQSVRVTLVDRRNFHLFQPLLYQVATGSLSAGDIASPLRAVLKDAQNIRVEMAEATGIDPENKLLLLSDGTIAYDKLIIATGSNHHYFGNEQWADDAPGLKTLENAMDIRHRVFMAFEAAERETDPERRKALLTFIIVGGGPTGVELAGAVAELSHHSLKQDFRTIHPEEARIFLLEGIDRILPPYAPELSAEAERQLAEMGVTVKTKTMITDIQDNKATIKCGDETDVIGSHTILWAAGVKASPLGKYLCEKTGCELDRTGRVIVQNDFSVPGQPDIFIIGDLMHFTHDPSTNGNPLPGVAPVAMQTGNYVARMLIERQEGKTPTPFKYHNKGNLAVIGRNAAVADFGKIKFTGILAWLLWAFVHIRYLVEFENRFVVFTRWAWSYITRRQAARLITGPDHHPLNDGVTRTDKTPAGMGSR